MIVLGVGAAAAAAALVTFRKNIADPQSPIGRGPPQRRPPPGGLPL